MAESESAALHRRRFLAGMVVAGGATIAGAPNVRAELAEKPTGNVLLFPLAAGYPQCPIDRRRAHRQ